MSEIFIKGNLGFDVETKTAESGKMFATLSVADTHRKNKEDKEGHTTWYKVKVFDWLAENCRDLKKGQKVIVKGRHAIEEYKDKNGVPQKTNVVYAQMVEPLARVATSAPASPTDQVLKEDDVDIPF